jgi:hypothetical protein
LGIAISFVAGLDLTAVALVLPPAVYALGFVAIYAFCRRLYPGNPKVALFVLLLSFATFSVAPDSVFSRNSMGFAFQFLAIACLTSPRGGPKSPRIGWTISTIIFIVALTLSHSLSAVLFGIFCGFWFVYPKAARLVVRRATSVRRLTVTPFPGERASFNALLVAAVLFCADVVWIGTDFFSFAVPTLFNASSSGLSVQSTFSVSSLRTQFVVVANGVVASSLLLAILTHLRRSRDCAVKGLDSALLILGVLVVGLTVSLSRLPGLHGFSIPTYRGLGFVWPFVYAVGIHSVEELWKERRFQDHNSTSLGHHFERMGPPRGRRHVGAWLVVGIFALVPIASLAQVNPAILDHLGPPDYASGGVRPYFLEGEVTFAENFRMTGAVVGDQGVYTLLARYQNLFVYTDLDVLSGAAGPAPNQHWLVLRSENQYGLYAPYQQPSKLTSVDWNHINRTADLSLVYSNGDVGVYAVTKP